MDKLNCTDSVFFAPVLELVDILVLETSALTGVRVQISPGVLNMPECWKGRQGRLKISWAVKPVWVRIPSQVLKQLIWYTRHYKVELM